MVYLKGPTSFFFFLHVDIQVTQVVKNHLKCRSPGFSPCVRKIPWRREWLPTSVFLPGESHGQRSLVGYGLWGHKVLDMTEQLTLLLSIQKLNAG